MTEVTETRSASEAAVTLCVVQVGTASFGIDSLPVQEVLGDVVPQRVPLAPEYVAGAVSYRGEILTVVSLRALLGMAPKHGPACVAVLESADDGTRFGLLVDGVGGVMTIDGEALEANPARPRCPERGIVRRRVPDGARMDGAPGSGSPEPRAPGEIPVIWRQAMKALIVDDSRFIRHYLRALLERMGMHCEEAMDGREALEVLRGPDEFDFMLLDVNMPIMGGMECVKVLRETGLQDWIKVMMVTTEADHSFIRHALESGADEFLMKPFTPESLREKLMRMGLAA